MADKHNPYIAGAPVVEKRMFFGREGVFDWIEHSLSGKYVDHILVLHGQRRVGKTSVLKHIPNRLPDRYIPVFIDLQGRVSTSLGRFLGWLAREITRALKVQGIELPRPDRKAFEEDPEYFENVFLPAIQTHLGDRSLLLTFDEFDTFESTDAQEGLAIPFMAILKRLMDHPYLSFIFSIGSSGRKLENMQAAYTSFFKQALYRKISFLESDDAKELIVKPVEEIVSYSDQAIDRILDVTSRHPYFVQLICHELFSECQKNDQWQVDLNDVDAILDPVVERGTVNLKFVWDEADDLEKWILAVLAIIQEGLDLSSLEARLKAEQVRYTRQELERALLRLREKDVITNENRFVIYLLKLWLQRNRPMEQVREELEEVNPIVNRLLEIGQEYHNKGEYLNAVRNFEEALKVEETNLDARLWLGSSQLARGDYGKAIAEFENVLEVKIDDVVAQKGYCDAYLAMGDESRADEKLEEAEYAYQQVLGINPEHQEAQRRMAEIHHRRAVGAIIGGPETALEELEMALAYAEEDAFRRAYDDLAAFLSGDRKLGDVLLSWGQTVQEIGLWDEAGDLLDAYRRESGDEQTVSGAITEIREHVLERRKDELRHRANRLENLGRHDQAAEILTSYLKFSPDESAEIQPKITELLALAKQGAEKPHKRSPLMTALIAAVIVALIGAIVWLLALPTSPLRVALAGPTAMSTNTKIPAPTATQALIVDSDLNTALEYMEEFSPENQDEFDIVSVGESISIENGLLSIQSLGEFTAYQLPVFSSNVFAIEIDFQIPEEGEFGNCGILVENTDNPDRPYGLGVEMQIDGSIVIGHHLPPDSHEMITSTRLGQDFTEFQKLTLILLSDQIHILLNRQLVFSVPNPDGNITYTISSLAAADNGVICHFDNYKYWNISDAEFANVEPADPIPTPAPTAIPLNWSRVSSAQFLDRDEITEIVFDPNDPDVIYAGAEFSGIYKTINGGITWTPVQAGMEGNRINSLIIHPEDSSILYAGVLDDGPYKTTNGGQTWEKLEYTDDDNRGLWQFTSEIILNPNNPDELYFSDGFDIFYSSNAGESWSTFFNQGGLPIAELSVSDEDILYFTAPWQEYTVSRIDPETKEVEKITAFECNHNDCATYDATVTFNQDNSRIFVEFNRDLFYSDDGGVNWQNSNIQCIKAEFDGNGNGLCVEHHLRYSSDDGLTWSPINYPNDFQTTTGAISPHSPDVIIVGGSFGIFKSINRGQTWENISNGIGNGRSELSLIPAKNMLYLHPHTSTGDSGTIYGAQLGQRNFEAIYEMPRNEKVYYSWSQDGSLYKFYTPANSEVLMLAKDDGPFRPKSLNLDNQSIHLLGNFGIFSTGEEEFLYADGGDLSNLYLSSNYGETWDSLPMGDGSDERGGNIYADSINPDLWYQIVMKLWYSPDRGASWEQCAAPQTNFWNSFGMWAPGGNSMLSLDPRENGRLFLVTTSEGLVMTLSNSEGNPCYSLTKVLPSSGLTNRFTKTVVRHPENPDIVYVGTANGFFISYNNGETWGEVNDGLLGALTIYSLAVDPNDPDTVYAATPYGVFRLEGK